jgi:hypothetical protein
VVATICRPAGVRDYCERFCSSHRIENYTCQATEIDSRMLVPKPSGLAIVESNNHILSEPQRGGMLSPREIKDTVLNCI